MKRDRAFSEKWNFGIKRANVLRVEKTKWIFLIMTTTNTQGATQVDLSFPKSHKYVGLIQSLDLKTRKKTSSLMFDQKVNMIY